MGRPLRVLHVVVNMNRGGAETLLMNLYRNIDRKKVQFDFLTCKEGVFDKEIVKMGGRVHRIPYVTDIGHRGYLKSLHKFFGSQSEYRIVHCHMDKMSGFVLSVAKKYNVPIRIAHSHNTQSEGGYLARAYKWYAGKLIRSNATHYYACSLAAGEWLFGKNAENIKLINNGIEVGKFNFSLDIRKKMREMINISEGTIVLGHVGRFSHQKNHMFILDIFSNFNKRTPNSVLVLIGEGDLRTKIEEKIKELKLESKVILLGVRDDIHHLLQAIDIFVFPSFHEGLPVTLIEAQSAGLPCLISEKITKEVDLGIGLIRYLSLSSVREWVNYLIDLNEEKYSRHISPMVLSDKGFNIANTALLTQESYLELRGAVN